MLKIKNCSRHHPGATDRVSCEPELIRYLGNGEDPHLQILKIIDACIKAIHMILSFTNI